MSIAATAVPSATAGVAVRSVPLRPRTPGVGIHDVAWSPDSKQIAFELAIERGVTVPATWVGADAGLDSGLYVVNPDGSESRLLPGRPVTGPYVWCR